MLAKPNFIAISGSFALVLMFSVVSAHYPGASDLDINSNGYKRFVAKIAIASIPASPIGGLD